MTDNAQTWHQDRPIYRQLMEQIVARILDNTYREGEMLPSVRQLASDFVVNPLTAARAYRELEEYTETRRGIGLIVKEGVRELLLKREQPLPARGVAGDPRSNQGARPRRGRVAQEPPRQSVTRAFGRAIRPPLVR